jgi:hypothetical protein
MFFRPDLVDMSKLPPHIDNRRLGVGGDQAVYEASPERGREIVESLVRNATPKIQSLLEEANRNYAARYGETRA